MSIPTGMTQEWASNLTSRPGGIHLVRQWDVFICHAQEDKAELVRPLAEELRDRGLSVWYDEFELRVGDSLRGRIDEGLANSQHGIVILSPAFFGKSWPESELDGLVAQEEPGRRRILPVWHQVGKDEVVAESPTLAGRYAARSNQSISDLADELLLAIGSPENEPLAEALSGNLKLTPRPSQIELHMLPSGAGLIDAMIGRHEGIYDFDSIPDPDLRESVAGQIQELRDVAEIWPELPLPDQERAKNRAVEYVLEMLDNHLIPQVGYYERQLVGPDGEATPWRGVVLRVAHAEAIAEAQRNQREGQGAQPQPEDSSR